MTATTDTTDTTATPGLVKGPAAPASRTVPELVLAAADRRPDAVAITCDGLVWTYEELLVRSECVRGLLVEHGVRPDSVVALCLDRSPELIAAMLGVLRAGGAYLALEHDVPADRRRRLVADARPSVVLTTPGRASGLREELTVGETVPTVVELPTGSPSDARDCRSPGPARPGDLAYISYTSGSTGEPKGVAVPHGAVARLVDEPDWTALTPDDAVLVLSPVAFDASTFEIWAPLAAGARLVVHPAGRADLDQIAASLSGTTVAWLTAGLFHRTVDTHLDAFAEMRQVLAGGDVVSPRHVATLLTAHPHLTVTNGYGPTENTTFTACWSTDGAVPTGAVPIGRPVRGTRVAVLDEDLRPVRAHELGVLHAAGDGLARGYLGRPAATADRFRPDPYGPPGSRMYVTGDLARVTPDGVLHFAGRVDDQIKIRGYRVEPGEVEAVLVRRDDIAEAVVVAQDDGFGGRRLIAYVVPSGSDLDPAAVREELRAQLPDYLVPWAIQVLGRLPLTRNGKVDRAALPAASAAPRTLSIPFAAPRSAIEARLCSLWGRVLDVEPVGADDDFFELGGHSLLAAELIALVQHEWDVDVEAQTLYLSPTVAELATALEGAVPCC